MIAVQNLTKRYAGKVAADKVTFSCEPGSITGFLGPNGAGKSTTLRMLTGLTPPSSGTATIHGKRYRELPNPGRVVGVMLDATAQHAGRTGRETVRVTASLLGIPATRADQVLERVGLTGAASKRVAEYSLGMRQRLGLAQALLGDPGVLVLDEPANGLDPAGIRWMRLLLREFADRGGTVLLSSHLLREVEATVDRLVVITGGRVVAQGSLQELTGAPTVMTRGVSREGLEAALRAAGLSFTPWADGAFRVDAEAEAVGRAAAQAGQVLTELRSMKDTGLEEWFLDKIDSAGDLAR
jgi:ABC-2 type transport system ATP-binding protein